MANARLTCSTRLHVAALPVMYLKGYEDNGDEIALSANSAILLPETGDVGYCRTRFICISRASRHFITELENQMRNLGISNPVQLRPM